MTQTGYTNAIVNALLGWLKGLASWVLKLFDLSGGFSPLKFLANNWMKLLIFFLILGVAIDLLVWLIRWRPYWVWFRRKRVIINDANFFSGEKTFDERAAREKHSGSGAKRDWEDREFIIPNARRQSRSAAASGTSKRSTGAKAAQADAVGHAQTDVFTDGLFNVNAKQRYSDKYEDEVFSVNDLPLLEGAADAQQGRTAHGRGRTAAARSIKSTSASARPMARGSRPTSARANPVTARRRSATVPGTSRRVGTEGKR